MSQPLVSVIVPVYNGGAYLRRSIGSILAQRVDDIEVLVVNDGSTDDTRAVLDELAAADARVVAIHQENAGVSQARNAALAVCRGRYIRFVDADDLLPEDGIEALIACAEEEDADVVYGAYTEVIGSSRSLRCLNRNRESLAVPDFLARLEKQCKSFCHGVLWNKLYRGDIIREHGLRFIPGLHWGEDFCFNMAYFQHCRRFSFMPVPVYEYIRNMGGAVIRQFFHSILHPIATAKDHGLLYRYYRELFRHHGLYETYRRRLWLYFFRFTLRN